MGKGERRHFSEETKLKAVRAALAGDKSFEQVAKEHGITANLLWYWRGWYARKFKTLENLTPGNLSPEKMLAEIGSSSPNDHHIDLQHEVNELRNENQALRKENRALKELLRQYLTKDADDRY
ncbi:MAG: transposase [Nitrososphaera sp.]|nr:transposase [Nitrososphaera sp.]